jgi:hypothetical protein
MGQTERPAQRQGSWGRVRQREADGRGADGGARAGHGRDPTGACPPPGREEGGERGWMRPRTPEKAAGRGTVPCRARRLGAPERRPSHLHVRGGSQEGAPRADKMQGPRRGLGAAGTGHKAGAPGRRPSHLHARAGSQEGAPRAAYNALHTKAGPTTGPGRSGEQGTRRAQADTARRQGGGPMRPADTGLQASKGGRGRKPPTRDVISAHARQKQGKRTRPTDGAVYAWAWVGAAAANAQNIAQMGRPTRRQQQ